MKLGKRCTAVLLQVQGTHDAKLEVHGHVKSWLKVKHSDGVPMQVQGSDKTNLEMQCGSVRARLSRHHKNSYKIRRDAGAR